QVVQTAKDSGLGLRMNGASVRLDEDSRIELEADNRLYLQRGRVYVDTADGAGDALVVRTDQGSIVHLGTQYLVAIAGDELSVAVREGAVRIDGRYYDASAAAGEQVTLNGTRRPAVNGVAGFGGAWRWTEALAPRPDLDGLPAARFLAWVSDETGYRLAFDDDAAERIATTTVLKGAVDEDPRTALRLRLLTMDLAGDVDEARGEIRIRSTGQ
ncbi:MAG TPA: FecR family protein, partial [Woeseiaceae bacterium]|nr:FecR family protein [Woeseiaceae bacterium]